MGDKKRMTRYEQVQTELRQNPKNWLVTGVAGSIGSLCSKPCLRSTSAWSARTTLPPATSATRTKCIPWSLPSNRPTSSSCKATSATWTTAAQPWCSVIARREATRQSITSSPTYRDFREGDVRHSQTDINKAQSLLGYFPTHPIKQGIERTMPWYTR